MVAVFLRLRLRQLANSLRRPPAQLLGLALLIGYAVAATAFALTFVAELRSDDVELAGSIMVIAGSVVTLCYLLVPLFFGEDDPADPRAFAALGLPPARIATGLALSSLISVPVALLAVLAAAQIGVWNGHPDAAIISVFSAIIVVVTCALGARLTRSIAAFWLQRRNSRGIAGSVVIGTLLLLAPGLVGIATTRWSDPDSVARLADMAGILGSTPLGAAWAAPAVAAAGDDGAWGLLGLGALFVVVLWVCWRILVGRMLVTPRRPDGAPRPAGLGWFANLDWFSVLPTTPAGAIAARSLSYWVRDGRYRLALLAVPMVPLLLIPPLLVAGVWWQNVALIPLPVMCLFLGWMIHNDTATDNTAIWLHIASNTTGWADRLGRTIPPLLLGLPLIAIGAPITARLYGVSDVLPSVLGVSACVLLTGLGVSSYVSARYPYPTVRPGDSPFAQPQSTTSSPGQALSFFGTIVLTLPVLALATLGLIYGAPWHLLTLLAGLVVGAGVYYVGLSAGARVFARRAPELLAFSLRN